MAIAITVRPGKPAIQQPATTGGKAASDTTAPASVKAQAKATTTASVPATITGKALPASETPAEQVKAAPMLYLPVRFIQAALSCASKEESRAYLNGVHISATASAIRIAGTDGHRLFIWQSAREPGAALPRWLASGVILSSAFLAPRLSMVLSLLPKEDRPTALLAIDYTPGNAHARISDDSGAATFMQDVVSGTFPSVDNVLPTECFGDRTYEAGTATAFNAAYLGAAGTLAKTIGATKLHFWTSPDNGPACVTFPDMEGAALVIMPARTSSPALSAGTAATLAGPMKGTLAALRAHLTRNEEALTTCEPGQRDAIQAKVASFNERIAAILAGTAPALPAPKAKKAKAAKATKTASAKPAPKAPAPVPSASNSNPVPTQEPATASAA